MKEFDIVILGEKARSNVNPEFLVSKLFFIIKCFLTVCKAKNELSVLGHMGRFWGFAHTSVKETIDRAREERDEGY